MNNHNYTSRTLWQCIFMPRFWGIHPDYMELVPFICSLPERFDAGEGEVIYEGRNILRRMEYKGYHLVIKSFSHPSMVNRFVYGTLRGSKAKRSYLYAEAFQRIGVGTPQPIAWLDQRKGLLLDRSFYVSLLSECTYRYEDLLKQDFPCMEEVLRGIGRQTALLHINGYAHKDYGRGNILFKPLADGKVKLEVVDLNRMYRGPIDFKRGCKNFERLPATPQMHRWMAEEYAKARGFDVEQCFLSITNYRNLDKGREAI